MVFVLTLAAAAGAGCRRDRCVPICEQRAKELDCHPTDPCKLTCERLHTATTCQKELKVFEDCFLQKPLADWECDSDGTPVVHPLVCLKEKESVAVCMQIAPPPPPATPPH